jgi:putative endonuclease
MTYYVYIMASASHALYTGVTNDIERRVVQHREARLPSFSARYKTRNLVYMEIFGDIRAAIMREKQIKGWLRIKKLALINSANPQWKDLSAEWPACKSVIASPGEGVILSGAKNPSDGFTNEKTEAKRPARQNTQRGSSLRSE